MHRAIVGPSGRTKVIAAAGVEIPFDAVAFPQMIVIGQVGGLRVEGAERGIKRFVVPHVEKLRGAIFHVGVKVVDRRAERAGEFGEIAVDRHLALCSRRHPAHAFGERFGRLCYARRQQYQRADGTGAHELLPKEGWIVALMRASMSRRGGRCKNVREIVPEEKLTSIHFAPATCDSQRAARNVDRRFTHLQGASMSEMRLVVRDGLRDLSGNRHGGFVEAIVAARSRRAGDDRRIGTGVLPMSPNTRYPCLRSKEAGRGEHRSRR